MLELDTTIMTPHIVFETSGHVARFADWMVKDTKTGEVLRADHLVKNVLETRLVGDKEARGHAAAPKEDDKDKKKKKRTAGKAVAVQLADDVVKEYQSILAQVRCILCLSDLPTSHSSTITPALNLANCVANTASKIQILTTMSANHKSST